MKGAIYRVEGYWVRVQKFGSQFRAFTNNRRTYKLIEELAYKPTREEAQKDLDRLADEHGWAEVREEEYERRGW